MGIPWNTIQGFAGATGIGAICILGFYLIIDGSNSKIYHYLNTYAKTPSWTLLASIPSLAIAYIVGLYAIFLSSSISSFAFGTPDIDQVERIMIVSQTKNDLLLKHLFSLDQKAELLNGSSLAFLLIGIGSFFKIKNLPNLKTVIRICGIIAISISISVFCFGNIASIDTQYFVKKIQSSIQLIKK